MAVQFTEAEWLIMSSMGYVNPGDKFNADGYPKKGQTVYVEDLLKQLRHQAVTGGMDSANFKSEIDRQNYLNAIDSLSEKLKGGNYVVSKSINHNGSDESGFCAFAIEPRPNPDKDVIVCCRGSDAIGSDTTNDWINTNLASAFVTPNPQQKEMEQFMDGMEDYNNIYLTGHSLGANLAMYGAITFSDLSKIKGVYAVDGPGFNAAFVAQYQKEIRKLKDRIYNYQNEHDIVSSSLYSVGTVIICESAIDDINGGTNHNRWTIRVTSDSKIARNSTGKKDVICQQWHESTVTYNVPKVLFTLLVAAGTFLIDTVVNKIKEWLFKHSAGYGYSSSHPDLIVNTDRMNTYAAKLASLSRRAKTLDRDMNSYYWQLLIEWDAIPRLAKLLKVGIGLDFAYRLDKCANYLRETAADFENVEKQLSNI